MKKTLFAVLLLTSAVCSAQPARTRENTNGSWNLQNLSVENWNSKNLIIAGTTENSAVGLRPVFKMTNPNLVPTGFGPTAPTFNISLPASAYLMDFTIDDPTGFLYFTGMSAASPMVMYVGVYNLNTGATAVSNVNLTGTAISRIPHQIILSPGGATGIPQLAIVGTELIGTPTASNFSTLPKQGFLLTLNVPAFGIFNVNGYILTDTPSTTGGNDYDALESVTEVPGLGYFAGGSANGVGLTGEQNMMVMNANYASVPGPSCIIDNTNLRSVVASVMYNAASSRVIVLSNNSALGTYELTGFNPGTVTPSTPSFRHTLSCFTGASAFVNGFRLQQNAAGNQVVIAGYIWTPGVNPQLTPFQTTTNPGLGAFINAKTFQSQNNSPLTGYFNESGSPVFLNTPDVVTFHANSNRTFLVNPNSNFGFDMLRSVSTANLACETACQFGTTTNTWPFTLGAVSYTTPTVTLAGLGGSYSGRAVANTVLCSSTPLAPIDEEPGLEMGQAVKFFPNPAKDHLEIESASTIETAVIYDLKGNKVLSASNSEARGIQQLDISMLKAGVYLITVTDSEGTIQRSKFIKE